MAATKIPQRVVDVADGHHEMARARMAVRAIHLVPDALYRERVLADDEWSERSEQNRQRFLAEQGYAYRIVDAGDLETI